MSLGRVNTKTQILARKQKRKLPFRSISRTDLKDLIPHFRFTFSQRIIRLFSLSLSLSLSPWRWALATCYRVEHAARLPIYIYICMYINKCVKEQGCTKFSYSECHDDVDGGSTFKLYSAADSRYSRLPSLKRSSS